VPAVPQRPPRHAPVFWSVGLAFVLSALSSVPAHAIFGELIPAAPFGWPAGAVPRNAPDADSASALLPLELLPAPAVTWLNWSVHQNAGIIGTWHDDFHLDGQLIQLVTRSSVEPGARFWTEINRGPLAIEGGRHALTTVCDPAWTSNEEFTNRGNNTWTWQYIWRPTPLVPGEFARPHPPEGVPDGLPNCSAFAFTRTPGTAWIVSVGSELPNPLFPLVLYDDYVNSTTGLSHELARSVRAGGPTNYVVGSASGAAATLYPAVMRAVGSAPNAVSVAAADASGRQSANGIATWSGVSLPGHHSAQVYEAYLTAGVGESATLTRFLGASDLEIAVFPPGTTAAGRAQAQWVGSARDGDDEYDDLSFVAPETGWYLFVVGRVDGQHLAEGCGYTLVLSALGTLEAPARTFEAAALAAAPSPASGPMRLAFALARDEQVRLEVFDLAGRAVRRLEDGALPAGAHARTWEGATTSAARRLRGATGCGSPPARAVRAWESCGFANPMRHNQRRA
jgi:hypothetical protein